PVEPTTMTTSSPTLRRPPTYLPKEVPSDQPAPPPPPPTPKPPTPAPADAKREPRSTPAPTGRAGGAKCTVGEVGRGTAGDGTTIAWAVAGLSSSFSACSASDRSAAPAWAGPAARRSPAAAAGQIGRAHV